MSKKDLTTTTTEQAVPPRLPMPEPEGGWPADEFTGEPGRFVRDPYTGLRSRAPVAVPVAPTADE